MLKIGGRYLINSQRKGTFGGQLKSFDDTWATFIVIAGRAKAMLEYNEADKGEEVTVRRAMCVLTEQPEAQTA
jgi:hypothetical protein